MLSESPLGSLSRRRTSSEAVCRPEHVDRANLAGVEVRGRGEKSNERRNLGNPVDLLGESSQTTVGKNRSDDRSRRGADDDLGLLKFDPTLDKAVEIGDLPGHEVHPAPAQHQSSPGTLSVPRIKRDWLGERPVCRIEFDGDEGLRISLTCGNRYWHAYPRTKLVPPATWPMPSNFWRVKRHGI